MSFVDLLQVLGVAEEAEASSADDAHTLTWRDVRYAVGSRSILEGSTGAARPGRLLGVLGPSGSGKTTLLNILAGRVRRRRGAALEASVAYGGGAFPRDDVPLSYIEQDPRFFSNLTVRETLALDAALHGGDEADVDRVVKRLGLAACADTLVGGDTGGKAVRGISGGERRRLAIAAETLCLRARSSAGPAVSSADASVLADASVTLGAGGVILADEPTTGLDAHQADKIVEKLRELARLESAAVVCVLHQPRSAIFDRLDDLALVAAGGRVAYCGAAEDALAWFAERGHRCPKYHNPAEFLIDLVAVNDDAGEDEARRDRERVDALVARWDEERRRVEEGNDKNKNKNATPTGTTPGGGSDAKRSASEAGGSPSPSPLGSPVSPIVAETPERDAGVEAEGGGGGDDDAAAAERSAGGFETGFEALFGGSPSGSPLSGLFGPFAPATPEGAPKEGAAASPDAAGPGAASDADANRPANETTSETNPAAKKNQPRKTNPRPRSRLGAWRQFRLLAGRAWRQTRREAWVNGVRLAASAGLALAFGATNRAVGFGPRSIKRRAAVMMQAAINTSMLAICRSLNGFPRERATVRREMSRTRGGYAPGPYFFSKLLVETPVDAIFPVVFGSVMAPLVGLRREGRGWFLTTLALQTASASCLGMSVGALAPSAEMALAIGPCLMVLSIMLGDETGAFAEVPESLRRVSHASLIKWAFRGCLCAEFEGLEFDPEGDAKRKTSAADPTRAGTAKRRSGSWVRGGGVGRGDPRDLPSRGRRGEGGAARGRDGRRGVSSHGGGGARGAGAPDLGGGEGRGEGAGARVPRERRGDVPRAQDQRRVTSGARGATSGGWGRSNRTCF
jgi:ABC-type multidrug transport system ATPase subunit